MRFFFLFACMLLATAGIALGAETSALPDCLDVHEVFMTWPWFGKVIGAVAGSMGTIHVVTGFLLKMPFVQANPTLLTILKVVSALGFNTAQQADTSVATKPEAKAS